MLPAQDLLDGLIRDLLPLWKGFPSVHLPLDHLHVAQLDLLQFFRAETSLVFVLFLHLLNLKDRPGALVILNALQNNVDCEGFLTKDLEEFLAEPAATICTQASNWLELPHEKELIV